MIDAPWVKEMLATDPFAMGLGVELISVDDDSITIAMEVEDRHTNFLGVGHGGAVFSLADVAFSLASNAAGDRAVAIDTHMVLSAATHPGDRLTAVVDELTRGRTLGTYHVTITRPDGRTAAIFTGTVFISPS